MKRKHLISTLCSLLLALSLCLALAVPGFAATEEKNTVVKAAAAEGLNVKDFINELSKSVVKGLFAGGSGTKADPWQITNADQLNAMRFRPHDHFILCNDVDLSGVAHWTPIGLFIPADMEMETAGTTFAFTGELDGNGKTIFNFRTSSVQPMGCALFGITSGNASIHDLTMKDANVTGLLYVASLVGMASGNTKLQNLTLTGDNNIKGLMYVGGLVGGGSNKLNKNLTATANVTLTARGLMEDLNAQAVGVLYGGAEECNFENCKVLGGTVTATGNKINSIGGLAGCAHQSGYLKNCTVQNVTIKVANAELVGGLVGAAGNNEGLKKNAKRTVLSGNTVKNVKIIADKDANRIGMLSGGGFYTAATKSTFSKPGAFVLRDNNVSGTIQGGTLVGAVVGYKSANSVVKNNRTSVKWNGKALTSAVGATTKTVPVAQL